MAAKDKATTHGDTLRDLKAGAFVTLESRLTRGGSLQARRLSTGVVQFYWRYSHEGATRREPIGPYDSSAPPKKLEPTPKGYSVAAALEKCREFGDRHAARANTGGFQEHKADERRQHVAKKAQQAAKEERTLEKLLTTYTDYLKDQKRRSWVDAKGIFDSHVVEAFPQIAKTPAADVTPDQVLDILRRLIEQGKGRTANKVRSYMRAAYQCAIDVRTTASIPIAFKAFDVVFNPAAQTKRDPKFDRADKRPLSADELRTYWALLKDEVGVRSAVLRLHLLTGGQRIEQLVRLKTADVRDDSITIYDAKGRPGQAARPHTVPLVPLAKFAMQDVGAAGEFAISTSAGNRPLSVTTLALWAKNLVGDQIAGFQLKRIRSGVETLLAASGVSREIRGHLQSHGLTGVQARHYDGHDYMPEKRRALEILVDALTRTPSSNVVPIGENRAAR